MSDFIAANLHKKVDHIMDVFYGAGVASHPTIIEQINYLLFMRALSQRDDELRDIGVTDPNEIVFDGELEKYHWDNLLTLNAEQLFVALEDCLRKIPESTTNKTVRLVFRNAHIKLFDKASLRTVLHEIDNFGKLMDEGEHEGKKDIFGDTYEYLLSKLAQAGTSGQFRTPRHIIDFLVAVVAPQKGETILDPAVGTAGFLVKAFEYLKREYTSPEVLATGGQFDRLNRKEHNVLFEHTFNGFDSDEDMIKFGMMNLYLHGLQNAKLVRQNTLTDTAGNRDKYDIILANPPFSGKIDRDSVAEELQMNTGATEVLFLRYMMRHLTDEGRVGVIVPEGVLFNSSGAHTKIREMLLEHGLWCVVSLPSGVFNPYAGVKTSILFFDKTRKDKAEVLFAKVENDGFSLGAQRRPIAKNDLPEILEDIRRYRNGEELQQPNTHVVSYEQIKGTKDFNLSGDHHKLVESNVNHRYQMVELGELFEMQNGRAFKKSEWTGSGMPIIRIANLNDIEAPFNYYRGEYDDRILVKTGDLLFSWSGTRGTSFGPHVWARDEGLLNQHIFKFIPKSDINIQYVYRILKVLIPEIEAKAHGAGGLVHITKTELSKFRIPLPPLEIQKKIVEEIENKQKAIDHAREIIKTLERERAYFDPSARAQKEGWPIVKLAEITDVRDGTHDSPKFVQDGYPFVTSKNIKNGEINFKNINHIAQSDYEAINKRSKVDDGDIIMPMIGTIGGAVVVKKDRDFAIKNVALIKLAENNVVDFKYLTLVLNSNATNTRFATLSAGATQKFVSLGSIRDLEIPLPPLETQKQIVAEFAEEQGIAAANQKLIDLYTRKIQDKMASI